jgi:hypothetical protein
MLDNDSGWEGLFMLRKYGIWSVGMLVSLIIGCFVFYNIFLDQAKSKPMVPSVPPNAEVTQKDLKIKVTPETEIIQKIKYTKCGDEEVLQEKANQKLIGLTMRQVQQIYGGWTIDTFDTKEIVLTLISDGYCTSHSEHMFLGVHNGHVAVFHGEPGSKALLKEETNILLQDIQPQDRNDLEKGIEVKDRSELLQALEGLQEHR